MFKPLVEQVILENPKGALSVHALAEYANDFNFHASFNENVLYDALIVIDELMEKEAAGEPVGDAVYQSTIPVTLTKEDVTVTIHTKPLLRSNYTVYFGIFIEDLQNTLLQQ